VCRLVGRLQLLRRSLEQRRDAQALIFAEARGVSRPIVCSLECSLIRPSRQRNFTMSGKVSVEWFQSNDVNTASPLGGMGASWSNSRS
jgi:hypothetical protein